MARVARRLRLRAVVLAAVCALACGCGGGGGSGSTAQAAAQTLSISGSVLVPAGTLADSDTNDPAAPLASNDDVAHAQPLPNPVILGGHVNRPGAGWPGATRDAGDPVDVYSISLLANQRIALFIAGDGKTNDLNLQLYDATGTTLVAFSAGMTQLEEITVPADGDYLITVEAASGESNYVLSVGQALASAPAPPVEFVPGEVVVRYRSGAFVPAQMQMMRSAGPGSVHLLRAGDVTQRAEALRDLGEDSAMRADLGARRADSAMLRALDTRRLANALARRPDVASADPNYVRHPLLATNDPLFGHQWDLAQIHVEQAWDTVPSAGAITVAVIDTGVVLAHPDLDNAVVPGYDFYDGDANPDDPGDGAGGTSSFHGTHVAGTVAAETNNALGVAGVARGAHIMPLRVLGPGGGTDFDIIQALRFAAGLPNSSGTVPAAPARVANLSLGSPAYSQTLQDAITAVRSAGLVVVAAAGNGSSSAPVYPAANAGVISVSAVTIRDTLAYYSSYGSTVDVSAPGGDFSTDLDGDGQPDGILSTLASDASGSIVVGYGYLQGTSMAAPHVAGVVALMLAANPALTPNDIDSILASGSATRDLGPVGRDDFFGAGCIDARLAVLAAAATSPGGPPPPAPAALSVSPGSLNLGTSGTGAVLTLSNAGGGTLSVASVATQTDDGDPWLTVTPQSVDGNGLGLYSVTVDRARIATDALHTARITFTPSTGAPIDVPLILQTGSLSSSTGDAGYQYVLLVNAVTLRAVDARAMSVQGGTYPYPFSDVPPGLYIVVAGDDTDNNGYICDTGESCGAYPTLDLPANLAIETSRSGLDFLTGYAWGLQLVGASAGSGAPIHLGPIRRPAAKQVAP